MRPSAYIPDTTYDPGPPEVVYGGPPDKDQGSRDTDTDGGER